MMFGAMSVCLDKSFYSFYRLSLAVTSFLFVFCLTCWDMLARPQTLSIHVAASPRSNSKKMIRGSFLAPAMAVLLHLGPVEASFGLVCKEKKGNTRRDRPEVLR